MAKKEQDLTETQDADENVRRGDLWWSRGRVHEMRRVGHERLVDRGGRLRWARRSIATENMTVRAL
jgi:hypothetical protein